MLRELKLNDVVVANDLRVYYYKEKKSKPYSMTLFSTSKDSYSSLFSDPQNYFKHVVSYDHMGAQFMTDNFELVLRARSKLHDYKKFPTYPHYAKSTEKVVHIRDEVNVALHNDEKILLIYNLVSEQCQTLYDKTIKLHKALQ